MKISIRGALRASLCAAALVAGFSVPVMAQSGFIPGQVPLNDTNCDFTAPLLGQPVQETVPPCSVNGSRDVTLTDTTRTAYSPNLDWVVSTYQVDFDGQLQIDGYPIGTSQGAVLPFPEDASAFFGGTGLVVDLATQYTATYTNFVPNGASTPDQDIERAWFTNYTGFTTTIRSINVDQSGFIDDDVDPTIDGEYEYVLRSIDPANIVNGNSVELAGRFGLMDEISGIRFGKLSGNATLVSGNTLTPYPGGSGAVNSGILSPFTLQYNVVTELTTQLDENGLITPKVEVNEGVEMNGSRVTGLGAGVDAGDAVNLEQVQTMITTGNPLIKVVASDHASDAKLLNGGGIAIGGDTVASGVGSIAIGEQTYADTSGTTAIGVGARAFNQGGTALGMATTVRGEDSVGIGSNARTLGNAATAVGFGAGAMGEASVAIGGNTGIDNRGARAEGAGSVAIGADSLAQGTNAAAFGKDAVASAENSVALGNGAQATRANSISVGSSGSERQITNVAAGTQGTDAVNLDQLSAVQTTANAALAAVTSAQGDAGAALAAANDAQSTADTALADAATAIGTANQANDTANLALARVDEVIAQTGNVVGNNDGGAAPTATGNGAVAGGSGTVANGEGAIAFGLDNKATGNGAVAIGDPNIATGTGAVAIGADNTASGNGAVALGNLSSANGASAVALGDTATATGAGNVAIGGGSSATGANSVALGAGSVASDANSVSVGAAGAERRVTNVAAGTGATDAVNKGQLDTETVARQAMGVELGAAIGTETAARVQANLQMSQRLAVQETTTADLTVGLANEMSARLAADNALSARVDGLATRLDQIDTQIAVLDDRISSSTAVASALSGNAFLPDMKFNLTANVATYDGAHAGAIQMGVLMSPHVALNAGVASGFNRRGKTAARAGVTIGF